MRIRSWRWLLVLVLLLTSSAAAQTPQPTTEPAIDPPSEQTAIPEDALRTLTHQEYERTYQVSIPADYDPETAWPVLVVLHGAGGDGTTMRLLTDLDRLATESQALVIYPDGIQQGWNYLDAGEIHSADLYTEDWDFVMSVIEAVGEEYTIDQERVYVAGFSNGGMLAMRMWCEYGQALGGVAVIAANFNMELAQHCADAEPLPFMLILGNRDRFFPWNGNAAIRDPARLRVSFSVTQTIGLVTTLNNCTARSQTLEVTAPDSPVRVIQDLYSECASEGALALIGLIDFQHAYPTQARVMLDGRSATLTDAMWSFFSAFAQAE